MASNANVDGVNAGGWGPGIVPVLDLVSKADAWLRTLGFEPSETRFGAYAKALRRAEVESPASMQDGEGAIAIEAIVPYLELIDVHQQLAPIVDAERLKARLTRLLDGPAAEGEESPDAGTNDARNTGFELVVGAACAEVGAHVELPEDGDLTVHFGGATAAIECKRVLSKGSIRRRVKRGGEQLAARGGLPPDAVRLVAIDVSLAVRSASTLFAYPTHEAVLGVLRSRLNMLARQISHPCGKVQGHGTLGMVLFAAAPTHVQTVGFWGRAEERHIVIGPRRPSGAIRKAFERFRPALDARAGVRLPK